LFLNLTTVPIEFLTDLGFAPLDVLRHLEARVGVEKPLAEARALAQRAQNIVYEPKRRAAEERYKPV